MNKLVGISDAIERQSHLAGSISALRASVSQAMDTCSKIYSILGIAQPPSDNSVRELADNKVMERVASIEDINSMIDFINRSLNNIVEIVNEI